MSFYETVFIARQDATAAQVEALTESFAAIIAEQGGKITKKEYWGLRSLTYRIKKNRKGHYMLLNIDASPAAVKEMERNDAHQRGRSAPADRPGRSARGRSLGDAAEPGPGRPSPARRQGRSRPA